jgi:hypothetical protein
MVLLSPLAASSRLLRTAITSRSIVSIANETRFGFLGRKTFEAGFCGFRGIGIQPIDGVVAPQRRAFSNKRVLDSDLLCLDDNLDTSAMEHELETAPFFTQDALDTLADTAIPQLTLLGRIISQHGADLPENPKNPRLMINIDSPFTAVVCGVQGSGKSYTVSTFLENMLIPDARIVGPKTPITALVCHRNAFAGVDIAQPCEAAYIGVKSDPAVSPPPVVVFVAPGSLNTMKKVYEPLGPNVTVLPFYLTQDELDSKTMFSIMKVDGERGRLYVDILEGILHQLGENFTYERFTAILQEKMSSMMASQLNPLKHRLDLLETFLFEKAPQDRLPGLSVDEYIKHRFQPGQLTIFDLTDNFIRSPLASILFSSFVRLFVNSCAGPKALVMDEAHNYLKKDVETKELTKTMLPIMRQQRHIGIRTIIATQEPNVIDPKILELSSFQILHRISSLKWAKFWCQHTSVDLSKADHNRLFTLPPGYAFIQASTGVSLGRNGRREKLGRGYLMCKIRNRLTMDGGRSVQASSQLPKA